MTSKADYLWTWLDNVFNSLGCRKMWYGLGFRPEFLNRGSADDH